MKFFPSVSMKIILYYNCSKLWKQIQLLTKCKGNIKMSLHISLTSRINQNGNCLRNISATECAFNSIDNEQNQFLYCTTITLKSICVLTKIQSILLINEGDDEYHVIIDIMLCCTFSQTTHNYDHLQLKIISFCHCHLRQHQ